MTKLACLYCGHEFIYRPLYDYQNDEPRCPKCDDKNLKEIKSYATDIYGYNYQGDN